MNIPSASSRQLDKRKLYHWPDFTPPPQQNAAAPVAYFVTAVNTSDLLLVLSGVSVDYRLFHHRSRSVWSQFRIEAKDAGGWFRGNGYSFEALKDVSISLRPGDRVGILGGGGAGKTTLALVAAGILKPTRGMVDIGGTIQSIVGGGAGPHPEATVVDIGIYEALRRGYSRKQGAQWAKDAMEFGEIAAALNMPLIEMRYDDVQKIRLAIGLTVGADLLILDDVLSGVGAGFLQKMTKALQSSDRNMTALLVCEREPTFLGSLCREIFHLDEGCLIADSTKTL